MSAELLREAAALMRERAEAATPGPWQVGEDADSGERFVYSERWTELAQVAEWSSGLGNPQHIASWHPAVALAVADWINGHARDLALAGDHLPSCDSPGDVEHALTVARTYLGRDA